jgi:uncharacterized protein (DUF736 family)
MEKYMGSRITKTILRKKSNAGGIVLPDFIIYYRAITINTAWYWHKNRKENQYIRIEDPNINARSYNPGLKKEPRTHNGDSLFNNCCWKN